MTNSRYAVAFLIALITWSFTDRLVNAAIAAILTLVIIHYQQNPLPEWLKRLWLAIITRWHRKTSQSAILTPYSINLGIDPFTHRQIIINMDKADHIGIFAQTGGGKTTLLERIIHELVTNHSPQDLHLAICDMKEFDFRIMAKLPHLFRPIARPHNADDLIAALLAEMKRRAKLFDSMPQSRKCNDLETYHRLVDELALPFPRLPLLVAIIDEIQDVGNEDGITKLVKKGRALGIKLIVATQRNTVVSLSREVQSQLETRFIGYMDSNQEYGTIGRVPQEVYPDIEKLPGRFALKYLGDWQHLQVRKIPDHILERDIAKISNEEEMQWPDESVSNGPTRIAWNGSSERKAAMVNEWLSGFTRKPTCAEFLAHFDVNSTSTANQWINEYWSE